MTAQDLAVEPLALDVCAEFDAVVFFELAFHVGSLPVVMYILYHKIREPSSYLLHVLEIIEEITSMTEIKT